jgi:hypothetical protein
MARVAVLAKLVGDAGEDLRFDDRRRGEHGRSSLGLIPDLITRS